MPDGKLSGLKSKSDKGLNTDSSNGDFLYTRDTNGFDQPTTAEAMRRTCCFNFNNFIHSAQLMAKAMETNNTDSSESEKLRSRSRCNSGDSELVVLSVVLNKKQKENDEVALAIERLRQNGVNCVIFTMNDIRNGSTRADSSNCECFRLPSLTGTPKFDNVTSSCGCTPENSSKSESGQLLSENTPNDKIEASLNIVSNVSPTPSPSPPPQQPVSPSGEAKVFLEESNGEDSRITFIGPVKKKPKRKRKYPYSIRKPSKKTKLKKPHTDKDKVFTGTEMKEMELKDDCKPLPIVGDSLFEGVNEIESKILEHSAPLSEIPPVLEQALPVRICEENVSRDSVNGKLSATVCSKGSQKTKRTGRKSKGEKFEEAFQIAVQSFVETRKERDHKRNQLIGIPGLGRSMYTRSRRDREAAVGAYECNTNSSTLKQQVLEIGANRRQATPRPKNLKSTQNLKAMCIRNIFIGSTSTQLKNIEESATSKSDDSSRMETSTEIKNSAASPKEVTLRLQTIQEFDNKKLEAVEDEVTKTQVTTGMEGHSPTHVSAVERPIAESVMIKNNEELDNNEMKNLIVCRRTTRNRKSILQASELKTSPAKRDAKVLQKTRREIPTKLETTVEDIPISLRKSNQLEKKSLREFSPDITSRTTHKKVRLTQNKPVSSDLSFDTSQTVLKGASTGENSVMTLQMESNFKLQTFPRELDGPVLPQHSDANFQEVRATLDALISSVVYCTEMKLTMPHEDEWTDMPNILSQCESNNLTTVLREDLSDEPPVLTVEVDLLTNVETKEMPDISDTGTDDSLPDIPDSMQLRRSSFYSLVTGNVRVNLENYLDGRVPILSSKKRKRPRNGFLLHHGDNNPEHPESPYKLHLATQVLLKLNRRRSKCKPKEERTKNILSYLKLLPKRPIRTWKTQTKIPDELESEPVEESVFSGEWSLTKKYVCGVCGQTENCFWDMVTHKGEDHPGVVVTHVELPPTQDIPPSLIRKTRLDPSTSSLETPPSCSKCSSVFSTIPDLHSHLFDCGGNTSWLAEKAIIKRKGRRRGFKRRFSNTPKKQKRVETPKRRSSDLHKCKYCTREFKTEGWLKNHLSSHSLPVSIPLDKLPLASLPVRASKKKSTKCTHQLRNSIRLLAHNGKA